MRAMRLYEALRLRQVHLMTPARKPRETAGTIRGKLNVVVGRLYEIEDDLRSLGVLQASYRAGDLARYVRDRANRLRSKRKGGKA